MVEVSQQAGLRDRALGCLLGGALGDAWGGPAEGLKKPEEYKIPLSPTLSDDTQLTLATCESIVECGCVDPEKIATQLLRWFKAGKISGIGASTLKAMRDLSAGVHWALAGSAGEFGAGNGAAIRAAPMAFLLDPNCAEDRTRVRDVCRITHRSDES